MKQDTETALTALAAAEEALRTNYAPDPELLDELAMAKDIVLAMRAEIDRLRGALFVECQQHHASGCRCPEE